MKFEHHFLDRDLSGSSWGQTAIADVDGDGKPDYITGRSRGEILWYRQGARARWTRHTLGERSASDVGGAALDVDGDLDIISKLWRPRKDNANGGRNHVDLLENLLRK